MTWRFRANAGKFGLRDLHLTLSRSRRAPENHAASNREISSITVVKKKAHCAQLIHFAFSAQRSRYICRFEYIQDIQYFLSSTLSSMHSLRNQSFGLKEIKSIVQVAASAIPPAMSAATPARRTTGTIEGSMAFGHVPIVDTMRATIAPLYPAILLALPSRYSNRRSTSASIVAPKE